MKIELTYTELKSIIAAKGLLWQHHQTDNGYLLWATDSQCLYMSNLWEAGSEPEGSDPEDVADELADFVDNYKPTSNKSINTNSQPVVQSVKQRFGTRDWTFSHNFCDKTSWFGDGIRVVDEAVGTGDGSTATFGLDHGYVIDLSHGKVNDEDNLVPTASQGGATYIPEVKVDGVTKTERRYDVASGGDYTIDYVTGDITFFTPPANGLAITATYFYSPADAGSTVYVRPPSGGRTIITAAECMFSADLDLTNSLISAAFTYNPGLGAPPAKFIYPPSKAVFKKFQDFISYTNGAYPGLPAIGGTPRGNAQTIYQLRFEYVSTIDLDDAYGSEMRVWLEDHIPFGGEIGQLTFYGYRPDA